MDVPDRPRISVVTALRLPSNAIRLRLGSDDSEPREVTRWAGRFAGKGYSRFSVAVNTYYPEIVGGYYQNLALIRLVQDAFRAIACQIVRGDVSSDSHACPDEIDGILQDKDEYLIVRDGTPVGGLLRWEFEAGGGSEFLADAIVVDSVGSSELALALFGKIEELRGPHGVRVDRC